MGDLIDLRTAITRDVVRVVGPEAVDFLQGQLSQDVGALAIGAGAASLLLQPTGKVVAWLRVTRIGDDEVLLDVEAGFGEAVLERLNRFKLRTKAELSLEQWAGVALRGGVTAGDDPPLGVVALAAGWPGVEGRDLLSNGEVAYAPNAPDDASALEALRIECGVPAMGAELTEATIPAEAGQWLIDASVSFTKGCYTGQELVARIDSRGGNVPRPVRGLVVEGEPVPVGTGVSLDGKDVGVVTSSARSTRLGAVALAPLSRSVAEGAIVQLAVGDGPPRAATVVALPMR